MVLFGAVLWAWGALLTLPLCPRAELVAERSLRNHVIEKRFESDMDTDFTVESIIVAEDVGVLTDTLCVKGGPNKRSFGLFSTRGSAERCSGGPCPAAIERVDYVRVYVDEFRPHPEELVCFDVTILDDSLVEGREFFLIGLLDLRWGEVLSTISITIMDNDSPQLLSDREVVAENVGVSQLCLTGGIIELPLVVQTSGPDLEEMTEFITSFPNELVCVNFTVVDDELFEGLLEVVGITIKSANTSIGNFSETFLLYIGDNDETPQFEQSSYTVTEGDPQFQVCVVFTTDSNMQVESSLIFSSDGSAKSGLDYVEVAQAFVIGSGERRCVNVTIIDDDSAERMETFTVSLTSANSELQPFQATVTIMDNDVITFEESVYSSFEGESGVEVCLRLPSGRGTMRGLLVTESGSALERLDYFPLGYIFFNISDSERKCFFIYNYRDNLPEGREEFTVRVYTFFFRNFVIDVRTARVILEDDDSSVCANLTVPENGRIVSFTDENNPGSVAVYSCIFGYQLAGLQGNTRTCMPTGVWNGRAPTCQAIMCPILSDPLDGTVTVSGRTVHSVATYTCNTGYRLEGDAQRSCLALSGGVWIGSTPVCTLIECSLLLPPPNSMLTLPSVRTPGSVAKYSCLNGLVLVGSAVRICLDNGTWNQSEPVCVDALNEGALVALRLINNSPQINGGTVSVDFSVSGPVNKVTCSLGQKMVEEDFRYQRQGGMTFTDVAPGAHTLELVVTSLVSEQTSTVKRSFEMGSQSNFCGLHLINDGAVVDTHKLRVEFGAVPMAKSYHCELDDQSGFDCVSPVELSTLRPGPHLLMIMHNKDECEYRRQLLISFGIENTPDNPHNNV
ncbi:uncharacterized protein LOC135332992 [Halichondria panicea]|uniref:uncharacterized protein LOC135332992 n=1 Tax=Halichondria panicea TaxID=6063 RepID=UPI00312B9C9D